MKSEHDRYTCERATNSYNGAQPRSGMLRLRSDGDSPLAGEIPEPISQMERAGSDSHKVRDHVPRVRHVLCHSGITRHAVSAKNGLKFTGNLIVFFDAD